MQGAKKADVLACFGANIFFDDQDVHAGPASDVVQVRAYHIKKEKCR